MQLSDNVTHLQHRGRDIYLVGTAHISERSVDEVKQVIDEVRPDTVCIELDATRYRTLVDDSAWRQLDIFQIIKQRKVLYLLTSLVLSAYQRRLGEELGVRPGAEMLAAAQGAETVGAELVLADRDIQATLKRTWRNLSFWNKAKLVSSLLAGFFAAGKITAEQIEELKDRDTITDMMNEFSRAMPQVQVPLIDERDRYLMSSIQDAPGKTVVAVVGAGHVDGIVRHLGEEIDRKALEEIPPPSRATGALKWVIPAIVLAAFYYGYREHSGEGLTQMVYAWVLPNSVLAGLLTMFGGARPLTVLVAFVASPVTSLNPTLGAGMATGLVEAWLRKPTVDDCERLSEDSQSLRGMYRNRFTRVLVVALLTTIGSALGGWIGATWVVSEVF